MVPHREGYSKLQTFVAQALRAAGDLPDGEGYVWLLRVGAKDVFANFEVRGHGHQKIRGQRTRSKWCPGALSRSSPDSLPFPIFIQSLILVFINSLVALL
jgi:hypothetical protein